MLPDWFIFIAVATRFLGGLTYARAVIKRQAKPNPISWFFWTLTPAIVFTAQLNAHVGWSIAVTFVLGLSPLIVFSLSLVYSLQKSQFTPATIMCGILAAVGIVLWLSTNDPLLAIVFSILADICGSLPTVVKAYRNPKSEVALPYFMSVASMIITLFTIKNWGPSNYAFPLYILLINAVIFGGAIGRYRQPRKTRRGRAVRAV